MATSDQSAGATGGIDLRGDDPRLTERFLRRVDRGSDDPVWLVGVVHDHPASVHRARSVVQATNPDVLAIEVPPLAAPLFEQYATDGHEPPRLGGEYSAAIQAAPGARVVGIDAPNRRFFAALSRTCLDERVSLSTARRLADGVADASRTAVTARLLAAVSAATSYTAAADRAFDHDHDCSSRDDAETQAAAERAVVDRIEKTLAVLDRPAALRIRDETREACMSRRIAELSTSGVVVAVVGVGHLDALADGLSETA
ncbi:hypothetical protein [Halorarius litoreus]|uniref:hypothetical protein n=1 Tax=Halorarius litoreus TaxID=2962676 RepID=UPI0020CD6459|nr:hypothetical protein [Halorarius litoreus]